MHIIWLVSYFVVMLESAMYWTRVVASHYPEDEQERWSYRPASVANPRRYEGVEMNFLFPDFIAHGLDGFGLFFVERIKAFCDEMGTIVTMTQKDFPVGYRKELQYDLDSGLNFYDAFNFFGSWMPGLVIRGNHLMKLTDRVKAEADIAWSDILPAVRRGVAEFNQEIYMLPADGDVIVMLYRKDLLDLHGLAKPETWEEWLVVSKYFRDNVGPNAWIDSPNRTLAQEGGSGACMMTKRNDWAYANLFAFLSTFLQSQGPSQGIFFDRLTMEPLFRTAAVRDALELYKQIVLASTHVDRPCETCTDDGGAGLYTMVEDMQNGKCMMGFNYMGPVKFIAGGAFNIHNDSLALSPVPGSTLVKDQEDEGLAKCSDTEANCPFATVVPKNIDGRKPPLGQEQYQRVNRATYYSGGGQSWAISNHVKDELKRNALWDFFKGLIDRTNAVVSTTAADYLLDPFRQSTLDGLQVQDHPATIGFMNNGWKWDQLGTMKKTLNFAFNDDNSVLDLKIVDGGMYIEETDEIMLRFFKGELDVDETTASIASKWMSRVRANGLSEQRNLYRSVLGLPPYYENFNCTLGSEPFQGRCRKCDSGKFKKNHGSGECTRCPVGRYQAATGSSACIECDEGNARQTTVAAGATSQSECLCKRGYYHKCARDGDACAIEATSPNTTGLCIECPVGAVCVGPIESTNAMVTDNGEHRQPYVRKGFMSIDDSVYKCGGTGDACPGSFMFAAVNEMCAYTGSGIACASCAADSFWDGNHCEPCADTSYSFLLLSSLGVFLGSGAFIYYWNVKAMKGQAFVSVLSSITIGVTITFIQSMGVIVNFNFAWPSSFSALVFVTDVFVFDTRSMQIACILDDSLMTLSAASLILPLVIVAVFMSWFPLSGIVAAVLQLVPRCQFKSFKFDSVLNALGMVLQAFYISMALAAARSFDCFSSPNGKHVLRISPSNICWEDGHIPLLVVSAVAGLVYVVGFFVLLTWVVVQAPAKIVDRSFATRSRFVFFKYSPSVYWFTLPMMIRSICISLVTIVSPNDGYIQFFLMSMLLTFFGFLHLIFLPYSERYANALETVVLGSLIMILGLGSWFLLDDNNQSNADRNPEQADLLASAMMCSLLVCMSVMASVLACAMFQVLHPSKVLRRKDMELQPLVPKLRAVGSIFQDLDAIDLMDLLAHATYSDIDGLVRIVDYITLEICGIQPRSLARYRLPKVTHQVVGSRDRYPTRCLEDTALSISERSWALASVQNAFQIECDPAPDLRLFGTRCDEKTTSGADDGSGDKARRESSSQDWQTQTTVLVEL